MRLHIRKKRLGTIQNKIGFLENKTGKIIYYIYLIFLPRAKVILFFFFAQFSKPTINSSPQLYPISYSCTKSLGCLRRGSKSCCPRAQIRTIVTEHRAKEKQTLSLGVVQVLGPEEYQHHWWSPIFGGEQDILLQKYWGKMTVCLLQWGDIVKESATSKAQAYWVT